MAEQIINMPPLGESVTEAVVSLWLVKPGDTVKKYDPILEAVSDKVTTEIPAIDDGVIKEFLVEEGDTVSIGDPILKMETTGSGTAVAEEVTGDTQNKESKTITEKEAPKKESVTVTNVQNSGPKNNGRFSPVVVRLADEKGINLADVVGTGNNGRVTRKDVLNFTPGQEAASRIETEIASTTPVTKVEQASNSTTSNIQLDTLPNDIVTKASPLRKMIAQNLERSSNEIPAAWTMIEVDVTNLVKLRNSKKDEFKAQNGYSLSFFPFFIKAVTQALKNHPKLNSSWQNDEIITHKDINISIAVATDDALFVPVIKHADMLSIAGIASEINRLAKDVRNNQLKSDDMKGGTFTVNNTGSFGSVESMGIINYPQAAIVQVETIRKEVSVLADNTIGIRDKINLCVTLDHRLLDGLAVGRFLQEVKQNLESIDENLSIY